MYAMLYAYHAREALQVIDIATPAHPVELHRHNLDIGDHIVAVQANLSFISDAAGVVHIFTTAPAGKLQEVGLFTTAGTVHDVAVGNRFLLATSGAGGVLAVRFANGTQLAPAEAIAVPGHASRVAVDGHHGYVLTREGNLYVLTLDGHEPGQVAGKVALGLPSHAMRVHKGYVYIAAGEAGVYVVDVANPRRPALVGAYDTPGTALNVAIGDDTILVADGFAGLLLLATHFSRDPQADAARTPCAPGRS